MSMIDDIVNTVMRRVKTSGVLTDNIQMCLVSAVNSDGTIDVTHGVDIPDRPDVPGKSTYKKVRLLGDYAPAVGNRVEVANTKGGWVCLGRLRTADNPRVQSGNFTQAGNTGKWTNNVTVSFPRPFTNVPNVVAMCNAGGSAGTSGLMAFQCTGVTTTDFQFRHWRDNTGVGTFSWIATDQ